MIFGKKIENWDIGPPPRTNGAGKGMKPISWQGIQVSLPLFRHSQADGWAKFLGPFTFSHLYAVHHEDLFTSRPGVNTHVLATPSS